MEGFLDAQDIAPSWIQDIYNLSSQRGETYWDLY
jgi:hypothetical protein